jgi:hypothetical protein
MKMYSDGYIRLPETEKLFTVAATLDHFLLSSPSGVATRSLAMIRLLRKSAVSISSRHNKICQLTSLKIQFPNRVAKCGGSHQKR